MHISQKNVVKLGMRGEKEIAPVSLLNLAMLWALCNADKKNQPTEALKNGFSSKLIRLNLA